MTSWSIDAKSMASVKKQTDKIKALRLTVKQTFATMGDRVSSDVLKALDKQMQLKHSDTKISELVDVSAVATGLCVVTMTSLFGTFPKNISEI